MGRSRATFGFVCGISSVKFMAGRGEGKKQCWGSVELGRRGQNKILGHKRLSSSTTTTMDVHDGGAAHFIGGSSLSTNMLSKKEKEAARQSLTLLP